MRVLFLFERRFALLAFCLTAVFYCNFQYETQAMSVQPVVLDMTAGGQNSRASIRVVNDGNKPLPVEFEVSKIELDTKGEQIKAAAGNEFIIHPPQALIPPGSTQVFRIQWVGSPDLKAGQSYLFSVNQLPIKLQKATSGMQVVFNFGVVVNIAPLSGEAFLRPIKTEVGKDDKGLRRPVLVVENPGSMHAYLSDASLVLEAGSWKKLVSSGEIKQMIGLGLVQPGKQRRFVLPLDLPPDLVKLSATVDYKPKKAK